MYGISTERLAGFGKWAGYQIVAGERGVASFSTSFVQRALCVIARAT